MVHWMMDDCECWSLLVSVPTVNTSYWRNDDKCNVYVYLLPFAEKAVLPQRRQAGFHDFEEIGEDNSGRRNGVRQWYENTPVSDPSTPKGQLSASLHWADGSTSGLSPIKWHADGWGCAFVRVLEGTRQAEELRVHVTFGALLLADTSIRPSIDHRSLEEFEELHFYRSGGNRLLTSDSLASRIFASYSRKDRLVVEAVESIFVLLGSVQFVWDLSLLKVGELWNECILAEIVRADIFQFFWSKNASVSSHVKAEYAHALELNRPRFVLPVYWEEPMLSPPKALRSIHFARISVAQIA